MAADPPESMHRNPSRQQDFPAWWRNAINIGLPIVICTEAVDDCQELDELAIDFDKGILMNVTRNKTYEITPFPAFINDIMNCGGLINRIKRNLFS